MRARRGEATDRRDRGARDVPRIRRRSRGRSRRGPAGCAIYKIRNNRVYVRSKTTHISINQSHAPPPRVRRVPRSRSRGAGRAPGVAHLYIKYETIAYTSHPKPPIYRSRSPFATIAIARRRARRRRFPRRRRFLRAFFMCCARPSGVCCALFMCSLIYLVAGAFASGCGHTGKMGFTGQLGSAT